ncbi:ARM repeat superfamily protein [Actinidia rufa]|uniref:ARM repeat superfamily protein n=1 Tax=Actinidia rufa TaxID=165716 RepID=A0A7J0G8B5_9ERIC|nr:ARM repeat superfamily protein [Actinidia rufa]
MMVGIGSMRAEGVNKSVSGGLFWSTIKEEGDLVRKAESEESTAVFNENDDFDGGFPSLDGMLQWAIGHSDPAKLKETAESVQQLSSDKLKIRQLEIKELMERLKMPSDAQLMRIAVEDLNNSSLPLEDHRHALQELLVLVEPIDNANDLHKLGGLAIIIRELNNPDSEIRTTSAWILGKASQNNPVIQKQVLELGGLTKLMKMVKSSFLEEARKALYAVSSLIRNNLDGQELFYAEAGDIMLQEILSNSSIDITLRRKSVFLVADLAESQLGTRNKAEVPFFSNSFFLKSVVELTASTDLDLQEKALVAIKNLLQLRTTDALVFKDFCELDGALERMKQQLQQLLAEEYQRDYAMDVESLRREVELIFHGKLEKKNDILSEIYFTRTNPSSGEAKSSAPIPLSMAVQSGSFLNPQLAMLTAKGRFPAVRLCPRWTSGSSTTLAVRVSSNEGNKKAASVPNSNYVVPLDNSVASSFITRPLVEILRDLNKRIPDNIINTDDAIASANLIPWYHANRMLSFYAPGWCGEIRDVIFSENGSVTVVYRVTIRGSDGEVQFLP